MRNLNTAEKAACTTVLSTASFGAFAAVPAGVTTALTDALTDVGTIGAAVVVLTVGVAVFKYMQAAII